jgi:hypothetical protein
LFHNDDLSIDMNRCSGGMNSRWNNPGSTKSGFAPDLPIILAAPSARDLDAPLLAASGISEVVHHPLTSAELAGVLSRCLAANAAPQLH